MENPERLDWIDGFRGIAVAMVVGFHAWAHALPDGTYASTAHPGDPVAWVASRGFQGVSLFLILSGLCLSLPLLQRRRRGVHSWLDLRQFAIRRCRRILPPYYAAVALFALVSVSSTPMVVGPLSVGSVLAHVFLIQNITVYATSLNGSFWSLGLEWQWYFCFPIILLCCVYRLRLTLVLLAILAMWWHIRMHDLWGVGAPPARFFEFGIGIGVARLMVEKHLPHPFLTGMLCVLSLLFAESGSLDSFGLHQALYGLTFSSLILLAASAQSIRRWLSWCWLTRLGAASYSVYLMHEPVTQAVDAYLRSHGMLVASLLGASAGIGAGVAFFILIERPMLRRHDSTRSVQITPSPSTPA